MSVAAGALVVLLAVLAIAAVAADGLRTALRERGVTGAEVSGPVLAAGLLFALALSVVDGGAVLSWTFGVGEGPERALLSGVGVALGAALVTALGGTLLLGAALFAPPAPGARKAGLGALGVAAVAATLGVVVALVRLASVSEGLRTAAARPLALLVGVTGVLGLFLLEAAGFIRPRDAGAGPRGALALRLAVALALAAAVAAGFEAWWRDGSYATSLTAAASAAALLGLAALEPVPRLGVALRLLFLAALVAVLFA